MPRKPGDLEYSQGERARMADSVNSGRLSVSEAAREQGCDPGTVRKWSAKMRECGGQREWEKSKPRPGRNTALNEEEMQMVIEGAFEERLSHTSYPKKAARIFDVSRPTISRLLRSYDIKARIPAKKSFELTQERREERMGYALQYIGQDEDFWLNMIIADEKNWKSEEDGRLFCNRFDGDRYNPEYVSEVNKSGRTSANFYGYFSGRGGVGELVEIEGRFNAVTYLEILDECLIPDLVAKFPTVDEFYYLQDNSPVHTANVVTEYLRNQHTLKIVNHPAWSPDLNPIENMWGITVNKWEHRPADRENQNLVEHVNQVWDAWKNPKGLQFCANLAGSMKRRLEMIIAVNGGHIPY